MRAKKIRHGTLVLCPTVMREGRLTHEAGVGLVIRPGPDLRRVLKAKGEGSTAVSKMDGYILGFRRNDLIILVETGDTEEKDIKAALLKHHEAVIRSLAELAESRRVRLDAVQEIGRKLIHA